MATHYVGAPEVTPLALQRALFDARQRGGPGDYYGIGHALNTVGDSYTNLNRQAQAADTTANNTAQTDARLAQGYYPAQTAADVALANQKAAQAKQQQMEMQDVQDAVDAAKANNLTPGTPDFAQFVQSHVHTLHGVRTLGPEMAAAAKQLQNQQMQLTFLQDQVPKQIAFEMAKKMYVSLTKQYEDSTGEKVLPHGSEAQQFWQKAVKDSTDNVQAAGLKANVDPINGTITVIDNDGKQQNIDPKILMTAMKLGGNDAGFNAFQTMFNNQRQTAATNAQTQATQGKVDLQEAQAAGGGKVSKAPGTADDVSKAILEINKAKTKLIADTTLTPDELTSKIGQLEEMEKKLHTAGATNEHTIPGGFSLKGMYPWQDLNTTNYGDTTGRVPGVDYASPPVTGMTNPFLDQPIQQDTQSNFDLYNSVNNQ